MDLHITRSFVWPFLLLTAVALGLSMMIEIIGKLDKFIENADTLGLALRRLTWTYGLGVPSFLIPLVPVTVLVSGAFALAHLERNNELLALKASGVSMYRVLAPIFLAATAMSLAGAGIQEFLVPRVEQRLLPLRRRWEGKGDRADLVAGRVAGEGTRYFVYYNVSRRNEILDVYLVFGRGDEMIRADRGAFVENHWLLERVSRVVRGKTMEERPLWHWRTSLRPADLEVTRLGPGARSLGTLLQMARDEPDNGPYHVFLHSRLAYPLHGLLLLFVAVPVILSHESVRKSRLFGAGVSILLAGGYYAVTFLSCHLGNDGSLPPFLAVWLPVLLFGGLGVYLFDSVRT